MISTADARSIEKQKSLVGAANACVLYCITTHQVIA